MKTINQIEEYFRNTSPQEDRPNGIDPSTAAGWLLSRCVRRTDDWLGPVHESASAWRVAIWILGRIAAWGIVSYLSFDHFYKVVGKELTDDISWLFLFAGVFGWGLEVLHATILRRIPAGTSIEAILAGIALYATSFPVVSFLLSVLMGTGLPDPPLALVVFLVLSPLVILFSGVYVGSAAGFGLKLKLLTGQVNWFELAAYTLVGLLAGIGITTAIMLTVYGPADDNFWAIVGSSGIFAVHNTVFNARPVFFTPGQFAIMVVVNVFLALGFALCFWLCLIVVATLLGNHAPTTELLVGRWLLAVPAAGGILSEKSLALGFEEWRDRVGVHFGALRDLYVSTLLGVLLMLPTSWSFRSMVLVPDWGHSLLAIAVFGSVVWGGSRGGLQMTWRFIRRVWSQGEATPATVGKEWRATWEIARELMHDIQNHGAQLLKFPLEIAKAAVRVPTLRGDTIAPII